jgi:hypothetical protein
MVTVSHESAIEGGWLGDIMNGDDNSIVLVSNCRLAARALLDLMECSQISRC